LSADREAWVAQARETSLGDDQAARPRAVLGSALFLENLDAEVHALVAYVDAIGTSDDTSIPV
jgi:hypothetical protein